MSVRFSVIPLFACLAWPVAAQVYKWVDREGLVHYADTPGRGSRPVELPEISIYPFHVPAPPPTLPPPPQTPIPPPPPMAQPRPPPLPAPPVAVTIADPPMQPTIPDEAPPSPPGTGLRILTPSNDATLDAKDGRVAVRIEAPPGLGDPAYLHLVLDGRPATSHLEGDDWVLTGVASGSHVLEARLIDADGQLLERTRSVLFHLH
jgi:hypothetical protein